SPRFDHVIIVPQFCDYISFIVSLFVFFFFFSSRRRHTRWPRDWSSDVCTSDLDAFSPELISLLQRLAENVSFALGNFDRAEEKRSEERRVGKECRARWSRYH